MVLNQGRLPEASHRWQGELGPLPFHWLWQWWREVEHLGIMEHLLCHLWRRREEPFKELLWWRLFRAGHRKNRV